MQTKVFRGGLPPVSNALDVTKIANDEKRILPDGGFTKKGWGYTELLADKERGPKQRTKRFKPQCEYQKGPQGGKPGLSSNPKKAAKRAKKAKGKK